MTNIYIYTCIPDIHKVAMEVGVERPLDPQSGKVKDWKIDTCCFPSYLGFTIYGLEQDWLSQCQYKMTGWGIIFICGMVYGCPGTLNPVWVWTSYSRSDNHCRTYL